MEQALLRDLQLCELEMLKDIHSVCEKNNIKYYLSAGTLLGAVRHHGFIPWDDDVDIEMPFEDYLRFLKIAPKELGDSYFLQNSDTDPFFYFSYSKIRKNNTTMIPEWETDIPSHHGVWVDVFPQITVNGKKQYRTFSLILLICNYLRMPDLTFTINEKYLKGRCRPLTFFFVKAARKLPEKLRWKIRDTIVRRVHSSTRKKFVCYTWSKLSKKIPIEAFSGDPVLLKFEDSLFPAPHDPDLYLSSKYGDYMTPPPVDKRGGRHGSSMVVDLHHDWTDYYKEKAGSRGSRF